ncbi:hypothetical protein DFQ27_007405 [Actinomortierella ambigua]|uniref:Ubiquitin 3 binding protein But2 C-terminal domain-containing protein n=1 Tax=Actinomortierella ambigua TaxID=1343610 RepID=A0A9P6UBT2_9FUNG|nr:hypothetical protein DFQ27_007405 [Actinomortierella ambigua]
MKLHATTLFALCAPSVCLAVVSLSWDFLAIPTTGLLDITFPFNVANAPHQTGFYFAQQFKFIKVAEVGTIGLKPQEDVNGTSVIRGVFSSSQNGTTTNHPNCSPGADGGAGVSCEFTFPATYSNTFNMVVENINGTTWRGTAVDSETSNTTEIGEWTLPSESGGILGSQTGFIEYYAHNCTVPPFTEVTFFNPTSDTPGAMGGSIETVAERPYGCEKQANFTDRGVPDGHDISIGVL